MSRRIALGLGTALACAFAGGVVERAAAWDVVLPAVAREAPECVSWGAGRLDCFVRAANGHLNWIVYAQGKWSQAQDLGGDLSVGVSCVVRGPGGINCFAPTAKGVLAEIHLNGSKWSNWASLGGELAVGRASCVAFGQDHIACFARGRRGQLMTRSWDGGTAWSAWHDLGGTLAGDPACISVGGRAACYGRANNGQLTGYMVGDAGSPGAWVAYGGQVEGRPACAAINANEVACAVRGADQKLYVLHGAAIGGPANGRLVSSGDSATGDPSCIAAAGEFTCFARDTNRRLLRRKIAANGDMSDGAKLDSAPESTAVTCVSIQNGALGCLISDTERRLQFAMGGELNGAQQSENETAGVDDSPQGSWYLSSLETNALCRVRLFSDRNDGERRLEFGPDCDELPGIQRASEWQADEDMLYFLSPRGRPVVRFRLTGSGRWISPMPRMPYMLSRERPEGALNAETSEQPPAPGLRFERGDARGVVGQWTLNADGENCGVRLTDWPAGGGNAVVLKGPCPSELRIAQYWSMDRNAMILASGDGRIVARFVQRAPGAWDGKSAQGTESYTLTR